MTCLSYNIKLASIFKLSNVFICHLLSITYSFVTYLFQKFSNSLSYQHSYYESPVQHAIHPHSILSKVNTFNDWNTNQAH